MREITTGRVAAILNVVRGSNGFTLGLYLYTQGLIVFSAFSKASLNGTVAVLGVSLNPLQWTALGFAFGILLEALLEIPTGVLADMIGRKKTTVFSIACRAFFFVTLYGICLAERQPNPSGDLVFWLTAASTTLFSIHFSLQSGSFIAWAQDALNDLKEGLEFPHYYAVAQKYNWWGFLIGTCIGLFAYLNGYTGIIYLTGFLISCAVYYYTQTRMWENFELESSNGHFFTTSIKKFTSTLTEGIRLILPNRQLLLVFGVNASVYALLYLVDYIWPVFAKARFPEQTAKFSTPWFVLIFSFTVTSLLGSMLFHRWTKMMKSSGRGYATEALATVTLFSSLGIVIPIFLCSRLLGESNPYAFWIFAGLMAIHKLANGTFNTVLDSLQNRLIPANSKQRATILSVGAMAKNLIIVVLVYLGAGKEAADLTAWLIPAIASFVMAIWMWFAISMTTARKPIVTTSA